MGRVRDGDSARKKTRGDRPASGAVASGVAVIGATPTETPTLGWHGRMEHGRRRGREGGCIGCHCGGGGGRCTNDDGSPAAAATDARCPRP